MDLWHPSAEKTEATCRSQSIVGGIQLETPIACGAEPGNKTVGLVLHAGLLMWGALSSCLFLVSRCTISLSKTFQIWVDY